MGIVLWLLVGFSVGMSLLLAVAFATVYRHLELPWQSRIAGYVMLGGLALTQLAHLDIALHPPADVLPRRYVVVLFLQSLGFYWLLLGVLRPTANWRPVEWALPAVMLVLGLTTPLALAIPLALFLGGLAALHLCLLVYRLRAVRRWFAIELKVLALFAAMAILLVAGGVLAPQALGWHVFAWVYAALITVGFFLVAWLLLAVPDLVQKTREAVVTAYAQSTLGRVDCDAAAARLETLFARDHVYEDESLKLARVADLVGLTSHQLSELVNTRFGLSFSRYVRRHRIEAAKRLLVEDPRASVLSVGLSVGFSSQSNFYAAFKEQVGMVPGEYRKSRLGAES